MVDGLKAAEEALPRGFVLTNTITALLVQAWFIFLTVFFSFLRDAARFPSSQDGLARLAAVAALAAAISLPWALLALWRFVRHGTPERSIREIGRAVLESLQYEGCIDRSAAQLRIYVNRNDDGSVFCWGQWKGPSSLSVNSERDSAAHRKSAVLPSSETRVTKLYRLFLSLLRAAIGRRVG
jgi:hypothetical protein